MSKKKPIQELQEIQELFSRLEFDLSSGRTYSKDYGTPDGGMVRLQPMFDQGTSLDSRYRLSGIQVTTSMVVPIVEGQSPPLEKFPRVCLDDMCAIVSKLVPGAVKVQPETYIIVVDCGACGKSVNSYLQLKGKTTCLECLDTHENT